ncbi:MAG: hypothetical protein ACREBG_05425 [Pyrinomonadaceae bacterium]
MVALLIEQDAVVVVRQMAIQKLLQLLISLFVAMAKHQTQQHPRRAFD